MTPFNPDRRRTAALLCLGAMGAAPALGQTATRAAPASVTVVVEVTLLDDTPPADALAAVADIRALMSRQPGWLSEELLQNLNPGNRPHWLLLSRWVSMAYWSAVFGAPDFARLSAHGNTHFTIATSAFEPAA